MAAGAPLDIEREAWTEGRRVVAGMDEAGRGPLAGPVVTAAVVLSPDETFEGATDSKALPAARREELCARIRREARACSVGAASTREIERLDILRATSLAMRRALAGLDADPGLLLVDGKGIPDLPDHRPLVEGDRRSRTVACASIVAKVIRDRLMERLSPRYPEYGWASNKGYHTPEHTDALARLGPTPHHRRTFAPVSQFELEL